ncbi:MAG: MCP four helix bundle domain-containing protein [Microcoleus vaginatus WJT46-NPBG5]|jgi:methyl-accepting chemotaxis protein|nr:MCP four helix bundle domain-containing protein [Microcoleus vaginatus WJT46-NPBG5]
MNLQSRLIAAFLMMGLLVLVVAGIGWNGNSRLSEHINTIGNNSLPSVMGLWKINEGQTQVQSSERALLNTLLIQEKRQIELSRIKEAWQQIEEGFQQYTSSPQTDSEKVTYKKFLQDWAKWKQNHEEFMRLYQEFARIGILDPSNRMAELVSQRKQNSPEMARSQTADALLDKLSDFAANEERTSFDVATEGVMNIIKYNEEFGEAAKKVAQRDVAQTNFLIILGMVLGPLTAIVLGIILSMAIAKPLDKAISGIINMIVSSSTEIAATVEQQERVASEQAALVNQTSTTMEELKASSRTAAEQAGAAAASAQQALNLSQGGTQAVKLTLKGMATLQEKVAAIAASITRLSDQANQIRSISGTVSDLGSKTNMLALNAAVEAVRAGEHGKGFAVVAAEIRKLADESQKSAEKINGLVKDIQVAINSTVIVTEEGTKTVTQGVKIAQKTANAFKGVAFAIDQVVINNQQIALSAGQQAVAIQQVVSAMNVINTGSQQTASGITQTKVGTQKLNEAAHNLKGLGVR